MLVKTLGVMTLLLFSSHGWGWICRRIFRMPRGSWIVTATLGLGGIVFAGGILNLFELVSSWSLGCVILVGLVLSITAAVRRFSNVSETFSAVGNYLVSNKWNIFLLIVIPSSVIIFTISTQLPPAAYNYQDDYQKYFVHPIRMLQTGTVFGSSLSAIGSETLGGQAFIQAFSASFLPISYMNAMDAVLGLFMCLLLASVFTVNISRLFLATAVSMLAVLFIHPQYVNVSSLYLGSAMIMALIALSADLREIAADAGDGYPNPAAMGLLYAALLAMKTTFALFIAVHLACITFVVFFMSRKLKRAMRFGFLCSLFAALFISPWILLHAPHYLAGLQAEQMDLAAIPEDQIAAQSLDYFSLSPLFYGGTFANYTGLVAAVAVCGILLVWAAARTSDLPGRLSALMTAAAAATCLASFLVITIIFGPLIVGYEMSLRYFTSFFIGIAPAVFGLTALHMAQSETVSSRPLRLGLPLAVALIPVIGFGPSLIDRVQQALNSGSALAFSRFAQMPAYLEYNRDVLHGPVQNKLLGTQSLVPAGEPIIAWVNAPFYLDFKRNPIIDVEPAGLATPWADMPQARFVMWEYRGFATPSPTAYRRQTRAFGAHDRVIAVRTLQFANELQALSKYSQVLYDDGKLAVFRLP